MPEIDITIRGSEAGILRALQRVIDKENELGQAAKRAGEQSRQGAEAAKRGLQDVGGSLSDAAISKVKQLATSFVAFETAIGGVKFIVNDLVESFREQNRLVDQAIGGLNRLAALQGGDPEVRRRILSAQVPLTVQERTDIGFAAVSQGFQQQQLDNLLRQAGAARRLGFDPSTVGQGIVGLRGGGLGGFDVNQIASFLETGARTSPLSIGQFAELFPALSGAAGPTAREQAGAAASLSAATTALGGAGNRAQAQNLIRILLARRVQRGGKQVGLGDLIDRVGARGQPVDRQILSLSRGLEAGQIQDTELISALGIEQVGRFQTLARADVALAQLPGNVEALQPTLLRAGPSTLEELVQRRDISDPAGAAIARRQQIQIQRDTEQIQRGIKTAEATARIEEETLKLERRGFGSAVAGAITTAFVGAGDIALAPARAALGIEDTSLEALDRINESNLQGNALTQEQTEAQRPPALGSPAAGGSGDIR